MKSDCFELKKWQAEKDEERKKKGLPPYVPPNRGKGVASLTQGGQEQEDDYEEHLRGAPAGMLDVGSLECSLPGCCAIDVHDPDDEELECYATAWTSRSSGASRRLQRRSA